MVRWTPVTLFAGTRQSTVADAGGFVQNVPGDSSPNDHVTFPLIPERAVDNYNNNNILYFPYYNVYNCTVVLIGEALWSTPN